MRDYKVSCRHNEAMKMAYDAGYGKGFSDAYDVMLTMIDFLNKNGVPDNLEDEYKKVYKRITEGVEE